jgi:hypothetical protein
MKLYIYTILCALLITGIFSCKKDFLEVADQSAILREQYVKDLITLEEFHNGVYLRLTQSFFDGRNQVYPELIADNIKAKSGGNQLIPHYKWAQLSTTPGANLYNYQLIKSCNFVIEQATAFSNQNPTKANELKAQAFTTRALVYFVMVNVFANSYNFTADASHPGIALVTNSDPFERITRRNTVAEVYTAIINDLNTSISLFTTDNISSTLQFNKVAAKALLSRVLLFKGD